MKEFRKIVSMLLVLVFLSTITMYSFSALQNLESVIADSKMDKALLKVLDGAGEDDLIPISVWFLDIDHTEVKTNVEEYFTNLQNDDKYSEAIDVVFYDDLLMSDSNRYINNKWSIENKASNVSVATAQEVIGIERTVSKQLYETYNDLCVTGLLQSKNVTSEEYEIIYSCKYAPNVELYLTKKYICDFILDEKVERVFYINPDENLDDLSFQTRNVTENTSETEEYDTSFYNVVGISEARDDLGLDGTGMKVGMLEGQRYPKKDEVSTKPIYCAREGVNPAGTDNHSTLVAKLMVGCKEDYLGAIPEAELYYDSILGQINLVKPRIENLLDRGVTAINITFHNGGYNYYADVAKWYDHISIQHNVHLIISAGNEGVTGVPSANMAYNAIVVGACDNNGVIMKERDEQTVASSYCNLDGKPYKPDVVAPGVDIDILSYNYFAPYTVEYQNGYLPRGTSFSAPLVTSAVIQLSQASTLLLSNPTLMKSLLLSSSTITSDMFDNDYVYSTVGSDSIALSRMYGAGMLNVVNAFNAFVNEGNYITSSFSNYSTGAIFNRNLTGVTDKTLRFCLAWDKYNTVEGEEHETGTVNNPNLDNLRLEIVTPSGATYKSNYIYDNKQMITFDATEDGYYSIRVYRQGTSNSNHAVDYSIAYSIQ